MTGVTARSLSGFEQLLVADVLDFVVVELAQRAADDRLLLRLREEGVHDERDARDRCR